MVDYVAMESHPDIEGLVFRQRLARPGRGELWRAEQTALERDVLVAVFGPEMGENPEGERRFAVIRALAQVKSVLVPEVIDVLRSPEAACVVLEDPHAQGIVELLAGRRLEAGQIVRLAMRLMEGLAELHRAGMLYAGLCPRALYVSEDSEPVLPDVSLARFEPGRGVNPPDWALPRETRPYAAPELAETPEAADTRADMFALGLTLYALGTGQVPYGAVSPEFLDEAKRTRTVPSPCDISPNFPAALATLLARLAMRDPAARYADWDEALFDLHQLQAGVAPDLPDPAGSVIAPPNPEARARAGRTIRLSTSDLRAFRRELSARHRRPSCLLAILATLLLLIALALAAALFIWLLR